MAISLKSKALQRNLLMGIGGVIVLLAIAFTVFQYNREKVFKTDMMHARLQLYTHEMMEALGSDGVLNDEEFRHYVKGHNLDGLRVTIIDDSGKVLIDSRERNTKTMGNHLLRHEVKDAFAHGNGYDIKRTSESTHDTYFYSATRYGHLVVRVAVPYSAKITKSLQGDNAYIYFAIGLVVLLGLLLYFNHTIINLYWRLSKSEEDKVRIKRQLTQNAAHELKTPAASIHGYLETIIENPDMPAQQRQHFLDRCYAQSERMNRLLLDMAALTKLDEREVSHQKSDQMVDVHAIIDNVLQDTELQLQEKGIIPILEIPDSITIPGDASFVYSIFRNLVDNAIAYATGATQLRVTCEEQDKQYLFSVADNGVGVGEEHLSRLFERFYRVDKGRSRKMGGTGLGLAIVKNAVAAHNGTIEASTTPGGGLTSTFTLAK